MTKRDASGDPSELVSRTTLARFTQAGVIPTSANAVLSEMHRTWNRPETAELAKLYALATEPYRGRVKGTTKAQPARARLLFARGFTVAEIRQALQISPRTVYCYLTTGENT